MTEYEGKVRIIRSDEEVKVFTDPYRLRIIDTFYESSLPLTVKGVADAMGEVPAKVHYHVQKLLAIELIELDHIEVINGINAKYYKLITDEFVLDISRKNQEKNYISQATAMERFLLNTIDDYRENVVKLGNLYKEAANNQEVEMKLKSSGIISSQTVYLNDEDYLDFEEEIKRLMKKYSKKEEGKRAYASLMTYTKKV